MNILFIFPSVGVDKTVNHGIASLCGIIKKRGHNIELYQPDKVKLKELSKILKNKRYSLCLISSVTNQWPYALKMIKHIKKISKLPVFVGGHHATSNPSILENNKEIDGIFLGESDLALDELLKDINNYSIQNIWFRRKDNGDIIKNKVRNLIEDLDSLPPPDYSVFSKRSVMNYPALMFSRGCPYSCAYCCNNNLRHLYKGKGKYIRIKSVKRAIHEVKSFIIKYHPKFLNFDDDTFVKNKEWLFSFLDEYKKLTSIPFNCNTRPETLTEDICKKLKEANCNSVSIGIESGSEKLRKNMLNRHMSNEAIRKAFSLLKKYNIRSSSFNMVGIPGETYNDYLQTVKLNQEINPDQMQISIFFPYPATELGDYAINHNLINKKEKIISNYFSKSILNMKQFPKWKIKYAYTFFHFNVYRKDSLIKAIYYLFRYNLLKKIYLKKVLKALLNK